jgi:hypothetical protein
MMQDLNGRRLNFFIDYADADLSWAEWIAWQLENAHYSVVYRGRDFHPGSNIVQKTQQALRTAKRLLVVLSPDYVKTQAAGKTFSGLPVLGPELIKDPSGQKGQLLPVRVRLCRLRGLLSPIIPIELAGLDESQARKELLGGVNREPPPIKEKPVFPGAMQVQKVDTPKPDFPASYRPPIWYVPRDNPFFTDREDELTKLYELLTAGQEGRVQSHVLNGLDGIGKTQLALAYAYTYKHNYEAVFWIDASDHSVLVSGLTHLTDVLRLKLSKVQKQDEQNVMEAVRQWLEEHANWLFILDHIEDPLSAQNLIPALGSGHVLFTAETLVTGTVASTTFTLDELKPEDGALLLLRRAKKIEAQDALERATDRNRVGALELSQMLGNLPLMLDQAGAYIEDTGIDIPSYLEYYSNNNWRHELLHWRDVMAPDHPDAVVETWKHAFEAVQKVNPAAYDLLCFCAFLHHEAIPEEIISIGAVNLIPIFQTFANPLQKNHAIAALRKYALLYQDTTMRTFSMNRMVQEVLRDKMNEGEQRQWVERVIKSVYRAIRDTTISAPSSLTQLYRRYFPHVCVCASYIKDWNIALEEAAQLLSHMGSHLHDYVQQEHIVEHTPIVDALESYAVLLKKMNQLAEATKLITYADTIRATSRSSV